MTSQKRFMITVPDDIADKLRKIKKECYYDKSHSALYCDLIRLGLEQMEKNSCTDER